MREVERGKRYRSGEKVRECRSEGKPPQQLTTINKQLIHGSAAG